jgi:hypothetical protein
MHQNNFSLFLRHLLSSFNESKKLEINVKIKLGEQVVIKEKRYAIIVLSVKSSIRDNEKDNELKELADKNCIDLQLKKSLVTLEIPAIAL